MEDGGRCLDSDDPVDDGYGADEEVYYDGGPSLAGSLGRLFVCVVLGGGAIAVGVASRAYGWWVPAGGIALAAGFVGVPVLLIRTVRYRISNYRIDYERGVLSKDIDTMELWHVEDLKFHQSPVDRIFGIGDITVVSHDETTPRLVLQALPGARKVFENLKQRIITVKRQRGVLKIDAG